MISDLNFSVDIDMTDYGAWRDATNEEDAANQQQGSSASSPPSHASFPNPDDGLRHRIPTVTNTTDNPTASDLAPNHDYYNRLHHWIWNYQWQRFCWEQQQRELSYRMYWQQ